MWHHKVAQFQGMPNSVFSANLVPTGTQNVVPGGRPPGPQPGQQSLLELERPGEVSSPPLSNNLGLAVGSTGSHPGEEWPLHSWLWGSRAPVTHRHQKGSLPVREQ